jgi:MoxR-like ATPase
MSTTTDTDAIRERLALISGYGTDWSYEDDASRTWTVSYTTDNPQAGLIATVPDYGEALADLIAHAPADLTALLAENAALKAKLNRLATVRAYRNEDGRHFVFCDDVHEATR